MSPEHHENVDPLDDLMQEAAREYNPPPPVPTERIWGRIQARRGRTRWRRQLRALPAWAWAPVAAAAVLALGIGIGRLSVPGPGQLAVNAPGGSDASPVARQPDLLAEGAMREAPARGGVASVRGSTARLYGFAAARYLSRTEALLTAFQTNGHDEGSVRELSEWARDLLVDTRLLLESPAVEEPALHVLLVDLEVVLAEIVQMSAHGRDEERPWIEAALDEKSILLRLQTTKPAVARPSRG